MPTIVTRFRADQDTCNAVLHTIVQNKGAVLSWEPQEEPPANGKSKVVHRGKLTIHAEIVLLCLAREDKTVSLERVRHVLESKGFNADSVKPAISKCERSGFFEVTKKSLKLTDLAITPENVNKAMTDKGVR